MSRSRDLLAFAADLPLAKALSVYQAIASSVGTVKVGLSLFVEHGPLAVEAFLKQGAKVFLDLKLHDIPNTVELAAERAGALGVTLLTVHAQGGDAMLRAAVSGAHAGAARAGCAAPKVLAVTVLTSLSDADLELLGYPTRAPELAERLAAMAVKAGIDGLVCSAREVARLRERFGTSVFLCTPGIRPDGASANDQQRTQTPVEAVKAGSDLLVIGRPLYEAEDPAQAAAQIAAEL